MNARIGLVLSRQGGALKTMLFSFLLGLGGRAGSGKQWMSWISITDLVEALIFCLENPKITGPTNLVSPSPVTNSTFTETLAQVINRPAVIPLPTLAAKLIFGQMGQETILSNLRVSPKKLEQAGFTFTHQALGATLEQLLDKKFRD